MKDLRDQFSTSLLLLLETHGCDDYRDWDEKISPNHGSWETDPNYLKTVFDNLIEHCIPEKLEKFYEENGEFLRILSQIEEGYWEMSRKFRIPGIVRTNILDVVDLFTPELVDKFYECIDRDRFTPEEY